MEKSAIKDIFNGLRGHRETMKTTKENKEYLSIVCDTYDELKEKLSPEMLKLHEKLVDALENDWVEEVDFYFVEGFKLGLLIGIECSQE